MITYIEREGNVNYNPGSIISANIYRHDYLMNGLCFRWGFIRRGAARLITGHACTSSWPSTRIYRTRKRIRCSERLCRFKDDGKFMSMNAIENVYDGTFATLWILYVEDATKKISPRSNNPINENCVPISYNRSGRTRLLIAYIYVTTYSWDTLVF